MLQVLSGCVCSKGDFDGSVAQYIKTIGKLEPSYVIRKVSFLLCMDRIV